MTVATRTRTSPKPAPNVLYHHRKGVEDFVRQVTVATPLQLVEVERNGVSGIFLKDLSKHMKVPAARIFTCWACPRQRLRKKRPVVKC